MSEKKPLRETCLRCHGSFFWRPQFSTAWRCCRCSPPTSLAGVQVRHAEFATIEEWREARIAQLLAEGVVGDRGAAVGQLRLIASIVGDRPDLIALITGDINLGRRTA